MPNELDLHLYQNSVVGQIFLGFCLLILCVVVVVVGSTFVVVVVEKLFLSIRIRLQA